MYKAFHLLLSTILATGLLACSGEGERASGVSTFQLPGDGLGGSSSFGPCTDGDRKECKVTRTFANGAISCWVGVQLCDDGVWLDCADEDDLIGAGGAN